MVNDLRLYQLLLVKLLKDLDSFLVTNKFNYYVIAGTLLGAFRHKGFIPWDTDIDICMFREDYEEFLKFSTHSLPSNMVIDSFELDSSCKICFTRVRLKGTSVFELGNKPSQESGFYIDIFPVDSFNKKEPSFIDFCIFYVFKVLVRLKAFKCGKRHSSTTKRTILGYIIGISGFFVPLRGLNKFLKSILTRHSNYIDCYVTNYNSKYGLKKQTMIKDVYGVPDRLHFENISVNIPAQSHTWLNKIYGDWHKLPDIVPPLKLNNRYFYDFGIYSKLLNKEESYVTRALSL